MVWTYKELTDYPALKAADADLSPPVPDPAQAVAAIRLLTTTKTGQPFKWKVARRIAREAPTGDWSRIVVRARQMPADPPATIKDFAILAAINAVESVDDDIIDPNDPASWQAWENGLGALQAVGDLNADTVTKLNGLPTVVELPFADPLPTDQDLIHARSLT